ncbi:MAG: glycosyltransferase family 2 protein [Anaerolineae bacterium]
MNLSYPKVAIIILNWNGKRDTVECLYSVSQISYSNFEVFVVDNGSTDGSAKTIHDIFPDIHLLAMKENLGFAEGNNVAIRAAAAIPDFEFFLLLNNDTIVDKDILTAFVDAAKTHPQAGILGAKIFLYDKRETLDHFGGNWNPRTAKFDLIGHKEKGTDQKWDRVQTLDYVCGAALFFKKEVLQKIGVLEKSFFLIWEEADFCFRARKAGFAILTAPRAQVWHKVSASFVGGKPHSAYFWWRNRLLFIKRNMRGREKLRLQWIVLLPEIFHLAKLKVLKSLQLLLGRPLLKADQIQKKKEQLLHYNAALQGIKDYMCGRFGNGPSWIYRKGS